MTASDSAVELGERLEAMRRTTRCRREGAVPVAALKAQLGALPEQPGEARVEVVLLGERQCAVDQRRRVVVHDAGEIAQGPVGVVEEPVRDGVLVKLLQRLGGSGVSWHSRAAFTMVAAWIAISSSSSRSATPAADR